MVFTGIFMVLNTTFQYEHVLGTVHASTSQDCTRCAELCRKSGDLYMVNVRQPLVPGPEIWRPLCDECVATRGSWSQNLETFM